MRIDWHCFTAVESTRELQQHGTMDRVTLYCNPNLANNARRVTWCMLVPLIVHARRRCLFRMGSWNLHVKSGGHHSLVDNPTAFMEMP
eukprot:5737546-Ditylum_brightwellii.AAC.1